MYPGQCGGAIGAPVSSVSLRGGYTASLADCGPVACDRERDVPVQMARLQSSVDHLGALLSDLYQRLSGVIVAPVSAFGPRPDSKGPTDALCPLACRLREIDAAVEAYGEQVRGLLDAIQI